MKIDDCETIEDFEKYYEEREKRRKLNKKKRWERLNKEDKMDSPFEKGDYVRFKRTMKWLEVRGVEGNLINTNEYGWRHWNNFIGFNQSIKKLEKLIPKGQE